jgi:hypothetical protein
MRLLDAAGTGEDGLSEFVREVIEVWRVTGHDRRLDERGMPSFFALAVVPVNHESFPFWSTLTASALPAIGVPLAGQFGEPHHLPIAQINELNHFGVGPATDPKHGQGIPDGRLAGPGFDGNV